MSQPGSGVDCPVLDRPLVIAHLCDRRAANLGGSLVVARSLVDAQRQLGIDARLVYLYSAGSAPEAPLQPFESHCRISRGSRFLTGVPRLRGILRDIAPDVIHHHDSPGWSRIATLPGDVPHVEHGHLAAPAKHGSIASVLARRVIQSRTRRLIAVSRDVASSWEACGFPADRIRVVANGVDAVRFRPRGPDERARIRERLGIPLDRRVVLWAGRLDRERKGLDRMLAFAKGMPEGLLLAVAGGGQDADWLSEQVRQLPQGRRPILLGSLEDPAPVFGSCDAFLFTSRNETFGLVLLEAAVSGLPIYATECGGGGAEVLAEVAAMVLPEGSEQRLANAAAAGEFPRRPPSRDEVRSRYSWQFAARACIQVYREVVRAGAVGRLAAAQDGVAARDRK